MSSQVTLKQVAAYANVSYQTVSKVLNRQLQVSPETEQRILDAVQKLGYRPNSIARNMRIQRSFMLGYSWEQSSPAQINQILDQFLTSMVHEAENVGYHVLPFPFRVGQAQVEDYRDLIDTGRVDGFILSSVNYNDPRIAFLLERNFPFVAFGRSNPELDFPYVDVDGADGLRQAVEHLYVRGHRAIAALAWPETSRVGNQRMEGYFQTMQSLGLAVMPEWVQRGEGAYEFGRQAAARLLTLPTEKRPTAFIALNDTMAIGAMEAVRQHGLVVGQHIAIVGFDDAPMVQYIDPPLTTVRQPIVEAGRLCVEILVAMLAGHKQEQRQVLIAPQLIVRASA